MGSQRAALASDQTRALLAVQASIPSSVANVIHYGTEVLQHPLALHTPFLPSSLPPGLEALTVRHMHRQAYKDANVKNANQALEHAAELQSAIT